MSVFKPAYTLFLRTSEACNLGCRTCPAGRKTEEDRPPSRDMMTPEMLERILNRIKEQGRVINMAYHYYNEGLFIPWIGELVRIGQVQHGINGVLSSNLTKHFERMEEVLSHGIRNIIISVSGFTQSIYEISHKGGDIEEVKQNMKRLAKLKLPKTFVRVSWHRYPTYNTHEEPLMRQFATNLGFHFCPYDTGVLPLERVFQRWRDGLTDPAERDIATKLPDAKRLCFDRRDWSCIHQDGMITVDANGYLHACCVKNHSANMGYNGDPVSIFDVNLAEYNRWRKHEDARCKACKAVGLHVYAMQQYRLPNTWRVRAIKSAENAWRRLNLGGVFPWASALWTDWAYSRPQTQTKQKIIPKIS